MTQSQKIKTTWIYQYRGRAKQRGRIGRRGTEEKSDWFTNHQALWNSNGKASSSRDHHCWSKPGSVLEKNLTKEQKLLMRVVLGGDFMKQPPQSITAFKIPKNAEELLKNLKADHGGISVPAWSRFIRKLSQHLWFRKGANSQAGGLTVSMMHPFSRLESDAERQKRISILNY